MATNKGKLAKLAIGANMVGEIDSVKWNSKVDMEDVTEFGDSGHLFDAELIGFTIAASGRLDMTDTNGQLALHTGHLAGTTVTGVRAYLDATHYYSGDVLVESWDV